MVLSDRKNTEDKDKDKDKDSYRLFVAAANTNNVFVVGVNDTKQMKLVERSTSR